jgi:hypothetical protein
MRGYTVHHSYSYALLTSYVDFSTTQLDLDPTQPNLKLG